ncbi:hypothetical protein DYU11_22640 [Fibrisoma montanum]|uniref:Uncharacterized protein n=1 Tax=Fibrisoma montanum TaxID=2305895 RepID=A0A418M2B6_9BACT|nr:hypothetical protein [Fibrisoma montanum]RIV19730.1 hypothetical protein DYU11_22640 [Fibrisoma montanum]
MLDQLETIAAQQGLTFAFGEESDLNPVAAGYLKDQPPLLFHEGYLSGTVTTDGQGADEIAYSIRLWVLVPVSKNDSPFTHRTHIAFLRAYALQYLREVRKVARLSPVQLTEGIELTTRILDGLRLTFTATPLDPLSC